MPKLDKEKTQTRLEGYFPKFLDSPRRESQSEPFSERSRNGNSHSSGSGKDQDGQRVRDRERVMGTRELIDRGRISSSQRTELLRVVAETKTVLPLILDQIQNISPSRSVAYFYDRLAPLKTADCPRRTPSSKSRIRVVNMDTLNTAIQLAAAKGPAAGRVAVLNMASDIVAGGGWLHGSMAQEEELCYRSSLHLSLHRRYYPFRPSQALYSPDVVVIRSDCSSGHKLLTPETKPQDLPLVSVLSVAALRDPRTRTVSNVLPDGNVKREKLFADPKARTLAKGKMRLTLRMAAHHGHGLLVLGALGCGAFNNPKEDVAACWLEVLREDEFKGGWWDEIWFAVYDKRNEGNFEVFEQVLGGIDV